MKKIFSCILIAIMVMSLTTVAFAYTDTATSKYETAIDTLTEMGVVNGQTATQFFPNSNLTRAEAATVMVRALYGDKVVRDFIDFEDVSKNDWFYEYVNTACYYDLVHGMGDGTFAPNAAITVDQMITLVLNALGYKVPMLDGEWPSNVRKIAKNLDLYTKLNSTSGDITRGEACQVIYNALDCECVEWYRGVLVDAGYTLYEKMGFSYEEEVQFSSTGVIVGPTPSGFAPTVAAGQYWGCVAFIELYHYGDENQYTGFEIVFADDPTVYRFAGTCVTYYFVMNDGSVVEDTLNLYDEVTGEIAIQRGDELWFEMTYSNSGVYKILSWNEPPYDPNNATRYPGYDFDLDFGVDPH